MSDEGCDYYKGKGMGTKFVLVGYSCDDNKYVFQTYYKSEEIALNDIKELEKNYNYHYYCLYEDSECETKIYGTSFWIYKYRKIVASKRCSYKTLPIPLNSMLIGQFIDENIIGGRWVVYM